MSKATAASALAFSEVSSSTSALCRPPRAAISSAMLRISNKADFGLEAGDEAARPADPAQHALMGELPQRPMGRHPADAQGPGQLVLRGNLGTLGQLAGPDMLQDVALDPAVERLGHHQLKSW